MQAAAALAEARRAAARVPLPRDRKAVEAIEKQARESIDGVMDFRPRLLAELALARAEIGVESQTRLANVVTFCRLTEKSLAVFGGFGDLLATWEYYTWVARNCRELGMPDAARDFLDLALAETRQVKDEPGRSKAIAAIAEEAARGRRFMYARLTVATCFAREKLRVYTTILREITKGTLVPSE